MFGSGPARQCRTGIAIAQGLARLLDLLTHLLEFATCLFGGVRLLLVKVFTKLIELLEHFLLLFTQSFEPLLKFLSLLFVGQLQSGFDLT